MSAVHFSLVCGKQVADVAVTVPKTLKMSDKDLRHRIHTAALYAMKELKQPTIEMKISDKEVQLKQIDGTWKQVLVANLPREEEGKLTRVLGPSVSFEELEESHSLLGALLRSCVEKLNALFCFITGKRPNFSVPIDLLQDVIGASPKKSGLPLEKALAYWEDVLGQEASTEENVQILGKLKGCRRWAREAAALEDKEGKAFEAGCTRLVHHVEGEIAQLKDKEKMLIPTGFYEEGVGKQECLLEVEKANGKYTLRAFSIDPQIVQTTHSIMCEQTGISQEDMKEKIPEIIRLQLPQSTLGQADQLSFLEKVVKWFLKKFGKLPPQIGPGFAAKDVMERLGFQEATAKKIHGRPSDVLRPERLVRAYVRQAIPEQSKDEYKVARISNEFNLLLKATVGNRWLQDTDYRNTVLQSAQALLVEIEGIRKKQGAGEVVTQKSPKAAEEVRKIEAKLFAIKDQAIAFNEKIGQRAARESLKVGDAGPLHIKKTLEPYPSKQTAPLGKDEGVNLDVVTQGMLDLKDTQAAKERFEKCAHVFSQLAQKGDFATLEHLLPLFMVQVPIRKEMFKGVSLADCAILRASLDEIHQAACWSALRGGHETTPHFDFLVGMLALEAVSSELARVEAGNDIVKKGNIGGHREIVEALKKMPLSSVRSEALDKQIEQLLDVLPGKPNSHDLEAPHDQIFALNDLVLHGFPEFMMSEQPGFFGKKLWGHSGDLDFTIRKSHHFSGFERLKSYIQLQRGKPVQAGEKLTVYQSQYGGLMGVEPLGILIDIHQNTVSGSRTIPWDFTRDKCANEVVINAVLKNVKTPPISDTCFAKPVKNPFEEPIDKRTVLEKIHSDFVFGNREHPKGGKEFEMMKDIQERSAEEKALFPNLSDQDLYDLSTLCPDPEQGGYFCKAIVGMKAFLHEHRNLVTNPQFEALIASTLLRPGMWTFQNVSKYKHEVFLLLEDMLTSEQAYIDDHKVGESIRIGSLLKRLVDRASLVPECVPELLKKRDWIGDFAEREGRDAEINYLIREEMLGLYYEKYTDLLHTSGLPTLESAGVKEDLTRFIATWLQVNNTVGNLHDTDPGLISNAQSLIVLLQPCFKAHPEIASEILTKVYRLYSKEKDFTGKWAITFPTATCGDISLDLLKGRVFKGGVGIASLPPYVANSEIFAATKAHSEWLWTCVRTVDASGNIIVEYTQEKLPDVRVLISYLPSGIVSDTAIQRKWDNKWYQGVIPSFYDTAPSKSSDLSFPRTLEPLCAGKILWAKTGVPVQEIVSTDRKTTFFLKNGHVTKVSYEGKSIGILGKNSAEFFEELDSQVIGLQGKEKPSVLFTRAYLWDPQKPYKTHLQAKIGERGWEFSEIPGFTSLGAKQPVAYAALEKTARHPIIPPGITQFHLLEKKEADHVVQKVLIPLARLKPPFKMSVRGVEREGKKEYARLFTEVEQDMPPNQTLYMGMFDVDPEKGRLVSSDPVQNAYLAYLYFTQQRDSEATDALKLCKTGIRPTLEMAQIFDYILDWPDVSVAGMALKLQVLLQKSAWLTSSHAERALDADIKVTLSQLKDENQLFEVVARLSDADKRSFFYLIKHMKTNFELTGPSREHPNKQASLVSHEEVLHKIEQLLEGKALSLEDTPPPEPISQKASPHALPADMWGMFPDTYFDQFVKIDKPGKIEAFFQKFTAKAKKELTALTRIRQDVEAAACSVEEKEGERKVLPKTVTICRKEKLDDIKAELQRRQKELKSKQTELKKVLLETINPPPKLLQERYKQILTPEAQSISLERLLGSYVRGETSELLKGFKREGFSPKELDQQIREYLDASIILQHTQATLRTFPDPEKATENELETLATAIKGMRQFDINGPNGRCLQMLEYRNGYLVRPGNIDLVNDLLSYESRVRQLPPGAGKTEVGLPLMAILRADGYHLSTLITPEWLEETNRKEIEKTVREAIGQEVYCLEIPKGRVLTPAELDEMLMNLEKTVANRGVMLSTREHVLNLRNMFNYFEAKLVTSSGEQGELFWESYTKLGKVLSFMKQRGLALADEVDSIEDIHREVNKKLDRGDPIDEWKINAAVDLFEVLLHPSGLDGKEEPSLKMLSEALLHNTHVDLPPKQIETGLFCWAKAFCVKCKIDPTTFVPYLLQKPESQLLPPIDPTLHEKIVAAKTILSKTLPDSTLKKLNGVKEGYGKHANPLKVGPYRDPKTPDELSEYCDEFELLCFTIQDYIQTLIQTDQAIKFLDESYSGIEREVQIQRAHGEKVTASEVSLAKDLCDFCNLPFDVLFQEDKIQAAKAFSSALSSPEKKLAFCQKFVLPSIRQSKHQERSTAFDLADMFLHISGVTGTPFNVETYHDSIHKAGARKLGSDGETIDAVMEKKIDISILHPLENTQKALQQAVVEASKDYDGIIDIGAFCRDSEPEALAREMAETLGDEQNFVVFIGKEGSLKACGKPLPDGTLPPIVDFDPKREDMAPDVRKTLFQVFIGANIPQKSHAKFLVTIGNNVKLKDFIQGVKRLRQLHLNQTFDIILSPEVSETIREAVGKGKGEGFTIQDIFAYCESNEEQSLRQDILSAEKQKIARYPAQALFDARVQYARGKPDRDVVAAVRDKYQELISPTIEQTLADLEAPATPEDTDVVLDRMTRQARNTLAALREDPDVQDLQEDTIFEKAAKALRERIVPDQSLLPAQDVTGARREGAKIAIAEAQAVQMATATAVAVGQRHIAGAVQPKSYFSRFFDMNGITPEQYPESRGVFADLPRAVHYMNRASLREASKIFDYNLHISDNIWIGWADGYFKKIQYAVFSIIEGEPYMSLLDQSDFTDFQRYQSVYRQTYQKADVVRYGVELSTPPIVIGEGIPEDKRKRFLSFVVQAKLLRGDVFFEGPEEEALRSFIYRKGAKEVKAFIQENKTFLMSETNARLYELGECTLAKLLK